jgi:hypothetical protein
MIFEQYICLALTAAAIYTVVVAHLNISLVSFVFFQLLFYAQGPIITRDGFETTGVVGNR